MDVMLSSCTCNLNGRFKHENNEQNHDLQCEKQPTYERG